VSRQREQPGTHPKSTLNNPGDVVWFPDCGPKPTVGHCNHACGHTAQRVIAWGPDWTHYELVQCDDACAGACRTWVDDWGRKATAWIEVKP
jgi:hypothetical protein